MPRLSLAMITKNEEKTLERCLQSVKDIVDEIVVVDTGSTDKTVGIAKKYTDKVFNFKWIDDFSAARNYSFDQCTGDFILWLDADDIIKLSDAEKIKNFDFSDKEIIICNYIYFHDEYNQSVLIVPRERIIKRSLGLRWKGEIHEYIPLHGKQYISDIDIHHYREGGSSKRNLRILERIVNDESGAIKPDVDPRNIYYLGKEYHDILRYEDAIPYFERYVNLKDGKFRFWENYYQAYFKLAQCYQHMRDDINFKRCLFESIKIEDRRAEPYCLMGEWYMNHNLWDRAIQWYKMALTIQRPKKLLSSYQPKYYTWVPCSQISVASFNLGDYERAQEYNTKFLQYRPKDSRAINNKDIINKTLKSSKLKDGRGKKLNLGCNNQVKSEYINVDIFEAPYIDEIFDLDDIPYKDNTISTIYSEHSLEHVSYKRTLKAIKEWHRVLKPGGELILKMPDLEQCCKKYLETSYKDENLKQWYKYTIYGYQKSLSNESDDAQMHRWGYSRKEIEKLLKDIGFNIEYSRNYDGNDTPSLEIKAFKSSSKIKIGWIGKENEFSWNAAQTRLRVLNINKWLQSKGYQSDIVDYPDIINEDYDIAIVGKTFNKGHLKWVMELKKHKKKVYCDLCENLIGWEIGGIKVNDFIAACDKVICCSRKLEELVKPINPNTAVIEEAWE